MEKTIDIFGNYNLERKPFEDPLQNIFFKYYLNNIIEFYDHNKLYNDPSYLQFLYDNYFNHLIEFCESRRPKFPPEINVEEYVNDNENNKKIKDMSKMNGGNSFMVYRKYIKQYLESL